MAKKPPAVIGVLTEPTPPTWWQAHRHQVALIAGIFLGWQLCGVNSGPADHDHHGPTGPAHSTAPSATPTNTAKENHR
ncbi:hypothetical protein GL263_14725 [Streptomyces durbertensis]|uniref:Uncharacterized protein n=1 Tax=Streptomyces durbertensis TaxID=2448886 RepID=A0ABR6EHK8_9ACTN|nr:hypothetical protein [Streptomyces durbertensis]MBB1244811.1 hypothetical protein [Streptomyces durbertensis]